MTNFRSVNEKESLLIFVLSVTEHNYFRKMWLCYKINGTDLLFGNAGLMEKYIFRKFQRTIEVHLNELSLTKSHLL